MNTKTLLLVKKNIRWRIKFDETFQPFIINKIKNCVGCVIKTEKNKKKCKQKIKVNRS